MTITRQEFIAKFDEPSRIALDDQADRLANFLRSYALTVNNHTFTEAADLIDELFGMWYEASEEVATLTVVERDPDEPPVIPFGQEEIYRKLGKLPPQRSAVIRPAPPSSSKSSP